MNTIDNAAFQLDQSFGALMAPMVAFLMFGVALDLRWEQFRRILQNPRGATVGLFGQFLVLPATAFAAGLWLTESHSVALGLLLVTACPAGALSNYVTTVVRGNAATSVSMTAVGTLACVLATPLVFGFWVSMNPATSAFLRQTPVDPKLFAAMFMVGMAIPVSAGMALNARRPGLARRIRPWVRRIAGALFVTVVGIAFVNYIEPVLRYAREAVLPVVTTLLASAGVSWAVASAAGVTQPDRRAVVLEVIGQNVAVALTMALAFFPALGGVAVTTAAWGFTQIVVYLVLVACWRAPSNREATMQVPSAFNQTRPPCVAHAAQAGRRTVLETRHPT